MTDYIEDTRAILHIQSFMVNFSSFKEIMEVENVFDTWFSGIL